METVETERGWGSEVWFQEAGDYCELFAWLECFSLVNNDATVVVKLILLSPPAAKVPAHCLLDMGKE